MLSNARTPEDLLRKEPRCIEEQKTLLRQAEVGVIIDIETTALAPKSRGEIVEVGAVKVNLRTGETLDTFSSFASPKFTNKISKKTTEITGITNDMVQGSPYFVNLVPALYDFIGDSLVICHNVAFDWFRFLIPLMQQGGRICTNEAVCTLMLSRAINTHLKGHKLSDLCVEYGAVNENAHRAIHDAQATAFIATKIRQDILCQESLIDQSIVNGYQKVEFLKEEDFKLYRASPYTPKTASLGKFIYFKTSIGTLVYGFKKGVFEFQTLSIAKNVDMKEVEKWILKQSRVENQAAIWAKCTSYAS